MVQISVSRMIVCHTGHVMIGWSWEGLGQDAKLGHILMMVSSLLTCFHFIHSFIHSLLNSGSCITYSFSLVCLMRLLFIIPLPLLISNWLFLSSGSRPLTDYMLDSYKHHPKSSTYTGPLYHDYTKPNDYTRSTLNSSFNSDSSCGTTPYITTRKTRDYSKPIAPRSTSDVRLGKRIVVTRTCGNVGRGVVRYVGSLPNRKGSYVGVELDYPGKSIQ